MELNQYQRMARNTAIYPESEGLCYTVLGLVGEAGEIAEKVKKMMRDGIEPQKVHEDILYELGDVLWYVANLAHEIGTTLEDVAHANLMKIEDRVARCQIHGDGDNR